MKTTILKENMSSSAKTETQTTYDYLLNPNQYLSDVFDTLPTNSIINKGRCGIGGTHLEINADRNSIIIVPTNAIIDNKCFENGILKENFYVVRGRYDANAHKTGLKAFMQSLKTKKKIFCTPEGLSKIMTCGISAEIIYNNWFLLLDESHTTITDNFRKNILDVFNYFFKFKNRSIISATPYQFSNPEFKKFDIHNITFNSLIETIEILNTQNVDATLYTFLCHPEKFPARIHIFLNSVNKIANMIRIAQITNCSIFCKDDRGNMEKLNELKSYFKNDPKEETFSKFNFYTSKYFEGWDLNDENATIIIVSDIQTPTLKAGISNKCIQATGRNRKKSNRIIHLTNNRNTLEFRTFEEIEMEHLKRSEDVILKFNEHVVNSVDASFKIEKEFEKTALKYSDIEEGRAILNHFKIDQFVNEEFCNQEYNNILYIKGAWEKAGYSTIVLQVNTPEIPQYNKSMSSSNKVKVAVEYLSKIEETPSTSLINSEDLIKLMPIEFTEIRAFYEELGKENIVRLGFNLKGIRTEYIKSKNAKAITLITKEYFEMVGYGPKTNGEINNILQSLYYKFGLLNEKSNNNKVKKAMATDLKGYFTDVKKTKVNKLHGFRIATK